MSGTKKKSRKVLIPTFEIAVCPTINLREMKEYRAKCQGLLVVKNERLCKIQEGEDGSRVGQDSGFHAAVGD